MDSNSRTDQIFPLPDDFSTTRIPNAILGAFLSQKPDADSLTLVLRVIWLLERQRTYPRSVRVDALRRDRVVASTIPATERFDSALQHVLDRQLFVLVTGPTGDELMLNTESAARIAVASEKGSPTPSTAEREITGWDTPASDGMPVDAFRAYEENIGPLTPMTRQNITAALHDFTDENVAEAIKIAVENESRSWAFVSGVLRRWARDGIPHESRSRARGRSDDRERIPEDQLRRYLDRQRESG